METERPAPPERARFLDSLGFQPDRFQLDAFDVLDEGHNVLVAAPTGAGKTLVAHYAVERALAAGQRLFYTTPIKALSNQKYHDLVDDYGRDNVGLLTGDNAVNPDAPAVVMTTEVLRNMLYAGNPLDRLASVVLDEVHYLQDAYRGPVWEEVIIHLPRHIQLVCLSATVSNASELEEWIQTVRGPTSLVVETERPVTLDNHYLVAERNSNHLHLIKTARAGKANPSGFRFDIDPRSLQQRGRGRGQKGRGRPRRKWRTPNRPDVVELLRQRDLLPAIHFIFSRAACDDAARAVVDSGQVLTSTDERDRIRAILAEKVETLSELDLDVLRYDDFKAGLEAGVAPHHAGMVPPFKEAVEACFVRGLVKMVFATETLALGINMPARTVVLEKLTKFTGDHHEFLTPAQYTQLTGRAGRRGIDTEGKAVVLWSPFVRFEQVAELALSRKFVLSSSFRPTYNMAANLVRRYDPDRARQLLNLSFAQFRADAGVVRTEHRAERLLDRRRQITRRIEREHGPVEELRAALKLGRESDDERQAIALALGQLTPGEAVAADGPNLPVRLLTLAVAFRKGGRVRVTFVDDEGDTYEVTPADLDRIPMVTDRVTLPEPYLPNSVLFVHEAGERLAKATAGNGRKNGKGKGRKGKGVDGGRGRKGGGKGGRHRGGSDAAEADERRTVSSAADVPPAARKALRRLERVERDLDLIQSAANRRAESLAGQFDRVIELLVDRGHLDIDDEEWRLTDSVQRLARLYHECDLLVVEALEDGLFDGLNPAEVAGLASCFVYEERGGGPHHQPWFPSSSMRSRVTRLEGLHLNLVVEEERSRLPLTRKPDPGFLPIAHAWAAGGDLDEVLSDSEITAGDFVRTAKQLIDLLRQLGMLAIVPATAAAARAAADAVFRDLVAASSMLQGEGGGDRPSLDGEATDRPEQADGGRADDGLGEETAATAEP
ncbi:MAG: DEAD/DEAH box helicase [Actinomycetota bacterium]